MLLLFQIQFFCFGFLSIAKKYLCHSYSKVVNCWTDIYTQTTVFVLTNNERCREIKHTIHSSVSIFYLLFFPYLSTCLSLALHCWVVFEHFSLTKESCFSWAHMILDHEWTIDPNKQCKTLNTTCMCLKKKTYWPKFMMIHVESLLFLMMMLNVGGVLADH